MRTLAAVLGVAIIVAVWVNAAVTLLIPRGRVDFFAAASGLVIVALQIACLPTLYAAYNRRETEVTLLRQRAGSPAWGPELLARAQMVDGLGQLTALYASWERWFAVMDAAAFHLAACPASAPFEARLCVQMGFTCLRQVGRTLRIPVDDDPRPGDPVQLSWEEFRQGWERVTAVGFPVERTAEESWPHFRGWRVNYETSAYTLARALDVVPARWSGPRRHDWGPFEPRLLTNRTPDNPEGEPLTPGPPATAP